MGMGSHHQIGPRINSGAPGGLLPLGDVVLVLLAPVHVHDHELGALGAGRGDVVGHLLGVLGAVLGEVRADERHLHALHVHIRDAVVAEALHPLGVQRGNGVVVARLAVVLGMVVGQRGRLNRGAREDLGVLRLAAEGELLVGPLAALGQRTLHVHHGKVVGAEQVGDVAQEVGGIALLGLPAAVEGPLVLVVDVGAERAVAGEGDGQRHGLGSGGRVGSDGIPVGTLRGGIVGNGSRSRHRISRRSGRRTSLGSAGAAGEQEPDGHKLDRDNNNEKDLQRSRTDRFRVHVKPFLEPLEH